MSNLSNKSVLLGVSGGIAAYKSPDLVRRLREAGAEVRVAMSANAAQFITPLTLQAVSGRPVHHALLDQAAESGMGHIELARWADVVLVAPASANFLSGLAHGAASDLLTTVCLATTAPIVVAPAMNQQMWSNTATRDNIQLLSRRDITICGPATGDQACGETGPGRMQDPHELLAAVAAVFTTGGLAGNKVVITAGPTWEAIDPVRAITNHSSGKMGYAIAQAVAESGAEVVLVSGPTALAAPHGMRRVDVVSAREMYQAVMDEIDDTDVFIGVAAVADYRPSRNGLQKIKKHAERLTVELVKNPDILATVAALPNGPYTVGFSAETEALEQHAREKLMSKGADLIAANEVGFNKGFGVDDNALLLLDRSGSMTLPRMRKSRLARALVDEIIRRYAEHSGQDPRQAHRH